MASALLNHTMTAPCTGTCCASCAKDRKSITALLRKFAIREDREELGANTGPRFKSELINPRKGTPTSYIAKYISKTSTGAGWRRKSVKKRADHCAITLRT